MLSANFSDGAPSPYGLPFFFYQKLWYLIKSSLLAMFADFHSSKLDIFWLNFVMLTLILKEPDASVMTKFRHIG